jgi:hypothetical protein
MENASASVIHRDGYLDYLEALSTFQPVVVFCPECEELALALSVQRFWREHTKGADACFVRLGRLHFMAVGVYGKSRMR